MNVCQKLYKNSDVDTIILLTQSNTFYLSGYKSTNCQIILTKDKAYFLTDMRYYFEAKALLDDRFEVLNGSLENNMHLIKGQTIGFEGNISYYDYQRLTKLSPKANFVDINEQINRLRDIKSDYEIENIIHAQSVTEIAFSKALDYIKEGITEIELGAYIEYIMQKNACDIAFDSIVAFGEHTSIPHAHRSDKKLKYGDFITMDIGAKYNGYCSDMTRTVCFGRPSDEQKEIYNHVLKAQMTALENIKAGITGVQADKFARDYFAKYSLDKYFTHSLGHGVGIDIHEGTGLTPRENSYLQSGMVVTVEPGLYIPEKFGVRIEDMVIIQGNSVKNLTNANKQLILL